MHPKEANESPTSAASIRAMGGCLCGCWLRSKIDGSGCWRVSLAINVAGDNCDAIADRRAVKHFDA